MRLACLFTIAAAACSGLDPNVEQYVKIDQGVYGQVATLSGTGACFFVALQGYAVTLDDVNSTRVGMAVTDQNGFYEIAAAPGTYTICGANQDCLQLGQPQGLIRVDGTPGGTPVWHGFQDCVPP